MKWALYDQRNETPMELNTDIGINDDGYLYFITFYDHDRVYGFSLTIESGTDEIEVMVADQSCYMPEKFRVVFSESKVVAQFPRGTIAPTTGEDYYEINYKLGDLCFDEVIKVIKKIFSGVPGAEYEII